jgi:tetraacyldisaccharide 4'-kinase
MKAPAFWKTDSFISNALQPFSALYSCAGSYRRKHAQPVRVAVPVICVGNITAGGAGKTPTVRWLQHFFQSQEVVAHVVSRGYGGSLEGPVRVDSKAHTAAEVGDEPLLLAHYSDCWVSRDRRAGVQVAAEHGADVVILDDGFQNPHVAKDLSILVIDGGYGLGNERIIPAGPLRETLQQAQRRAEYLLIIGEDCHGLADKARLPVLQGKFTIECDIADYRQREWVAFAGIGRPEKFFATLKENSIPVKATKAFADHYPYSETELRTLQTQATKAGAVLITTEKDWHRLPEEWQKEIAYLPVRLDIDNASALHTSLMALLKGNIS